jgi:hypothetical protein
MKSAISLQNSYGKQQAITLELPSLFAGCPVDFPESVLTTSKKGKVEVRGLDHRGSYVVCKYLDPKTMKLADTKRKLMLKDEHGKIMEYFIIPLKSANRALLVTPEAEEKDRQLWNEQRGQAEEIWI